MQYFEREKKKRTREIKIKNRMKGEKMKRDILLMLVRNRIFFLKFAHILFMNRNKKKVTQKAPIRIHALKCDPLTLRRQSKMTQVLALTHSVQQGEISSLRGTALCISAVSEPCESNLVVPFRVVPSRDLAVFDFVSKTFESDFDFAVAD